MDIKKLRSRWIRWHGQMMREDRFTWAELRDSNYQSWRNRVSQRLGEDTDFRTCIEKATKEELGQLDMIVLEQKED